MRWLSNRFGRFHRVLGLGLNPGVIDGLAARTSVKMELTNLNDRASTEREDKTAFRDELVFPLQVVINLNDPGADHTGGEFLLTEQRPRAQSRGTATLIPHGHGLVFTTRDRPVESARGWSAAPVRHGVSIIRSGTRFTLGLVFHDAA